MQAAVVVAVVITTAARRSTCRASLLLPPTGVSSDPSATATRPPEEGHALSAQLLPTSHRFCCQRRRDRLVLPARGRSRCPLDAPHSPPPIALCCAAPLRPSRAARRRDGCRGGNCVIVCVCIVCGATRAMRATRARGASTEPVECRKCSRHHRSHLADAVVHEHDHAGHRWKRRDEHDKLHQLRVDVLNVPSRVQRASAGCPS